MKVPFLNLQAINLLYKDEIEQALIKVYRSGWYILGTQVDLFERTYAQFSQTRFCVSTGNGLDALSLSLKAIDLQANDEVIVPANTYIATWLAITNLKGIPIPVEPDISTYNINPNEIEQKINNNTKAIIAVNLYGLPANLSKLRNIAAKHNIYLIEDNAQSHGAFHKAKPAGSWGDLNATSFYPGKNLGALGDGGAITLNNEVLYEKLKALRNYGSHKKYYNNYEGVNSRLDELQAAVLQIKLKYLTTLNEKRKLIADKYTSLLSNVGDLILPMTPENSTHVFHQYVIRTAYRDKLATFLKTKDIDTLIHYPLPPHLQQCYKHLNYKKGDFSITEKLSETLLSLPIDPTLTNEQIEYVIDNIKRFFNT